VASAACAGPALQAPADLSLRAPSSVSGVWFHSGCDDTGQGSGCGAPASEEAPLSNVGLVLEQGAQVVTLAKADARSKDDRYGITWPVQLPPGFVEGPAVLRAGGATLDVELRP
jgi:hypothetical protein